MVTTSPDNLWSPNATDPYNLTTDLATMQTSIQTALTDVRSDTQQGINTALGSLGVTAMVPTGATGGTISGSRVTFSGVNSVSVNGVFKPEFSVYRVLLNITSASPANSPNLRLRTTSDDSGNVYYFQRAWTNSTSALATAAASATSAMTIVGVSGTVHLIDLTVSNPAQATDTLILGQSNSLGGVPSPGWTSLAGRAATSTAYSGLTLYVPSGSMSGTIQVVGY